MPPVVSVLMPVYNAGRHLEQAMQSILTQSLRDLEVIAVDDGSTDGSDALLAQFTAGDGRVRTVRQTNGGIGAALNHAIRLATGAYLARMDADDVSAPTRLEEQVDFLKRNPRIDMVGSAMTVFWAGGEHLVRYPLDHESIRAEMLFRPPFSHPTILVRRALAERGAYRYEEGRRYAEDVELWVRLARVATLANMRKSLLRYRAHDQQSTQGHHGSFHKAADEIRRGQVLDLGIRPSDVDDEAHRRLADESPPETIEDLSRIADWVEMLRTANLAAGTYDRRAFDQVLALRWYRLIRTSPFLSLGQVGMIARLRPTRRLSAGQWGKLLLAASRKR